MSKSGRAKAQVVPEPDNPRDKMAYKVIIRKGGTDYKMGCVLKVDRINFPPGTYACKFKEVRSPRGDRLTQCYLIKNLIVEESDNSEAKVEEGTILVRRKLRLAPPHPPY
jgi:hypothetical protein